MKIKQFSKKKTIGNILYLAKEKGIKIGELEKNAGVSPGYLSRINREDNTSIPNIDLMYSISQQLNINLNILLEGEFKSMSNSDKYAFEFIKKLIDDTQNEKIEWIQEDMKIFTTEKEQKWTHPLFDLVKEFDADPQDMYGGYIYYMPKYQSKCCCGVDFKVTGNGYRVRLEKAQVELYLMKIGHMNAEERRNDIYELYMMSKVGFIPVCNSEVVCVEIACILEQLYETLEERFTHINLNKNVRSLIDIYMREE